MLSSTLLLKNMRLHSLRISSVGFVSGVYGGCPIKSILFGISSHFVVCHHALSIMYTAVFPWIDHQDSLILPYVNTDWMQKFLDYVASQHPYNLIVYIYSYSLTYCFQTIALIASGTHALLMFHALPNLHSSIDHTSIGNLFIGYFVITSCITMASNCSLNSFSDHSFF